MRSLTRSSFVFDGERSTVTIAAAAAKNRKEDTQPLPVDLVDDLRAHLALHLPGARAFPGMGNRGAEMLAIDMKAAGVPEWDEYGRVADFHSFRHTYGTLGAKAGLPLAVMQKLMRHSDPKLTSNLYTHILVEDKAEALRKLPTIPPIYPVQESAAKTGTADEINYASPDIWDTSRDTRTAGLDGETRTYTAST